MKKQFLIILCLLFALCLAACGSASASSASPASTESAAPSPTPTPTPSPSPTPVLTKEALVAELNAELRQGDEQATEEALRQYRETHGESDEGFEVEKNVFMQFALLEDGRIALQLSDHFITALGLEIVDPNNAADKDQMMETYTAYVDMLRQLQLDTQASVQDRLPGASVAVRLYMNESYEILIAEVENGEIVYDMPNGIDRRVAADPTPSPSPEAAS